MTFPCPPPEEKESWEVTHSVCAEEQTLMETKLMATKLMETKLMETNFDYMKENGRQWSMTSMCGKVSKSSKLPICVFPVRNSPKSSVIEQVSIPPPKILSDKRGKG